MTGLRTLEENIARLEEATEAARQATRDAHAAVKDLERKRREIRDLLGTEVGRLVEEAISAEVAVGLENLGNQFRKATDETTARVLANVDQILNLALGKPGSHKEKTFDLRPELAEKLRKWVHEQIGEVDG